MLKTLSFALGRSNEPLRWGPKATRPVRLVFLMAVPEDDSSQYLSLISGLVRLAKDPELLAKIHAAQDAGQLLELLGKSNCGPVQVPIHRSRRRPDERQRL